MLKIEYRPDVSDLGALKSRIEEAFYQNLGVEGEAELLPAGTIIRTGPKAQRLVKTY